MLTMDQINSIRTQYYEQGKNISEIAKETGLNRKTVAKYVDKEDFNDPQKESVQKKVLCPKLDPYKALIDEWLTADKTASRKQRHTAKRVFHRLKKEAENFNCSYRLVDLYVQEKKKELNLKRKEGYLPLIHAPGEAQGDFGAADFVENGKLHHGKYFTLSFPQSNAGFIQLNYGENKECLFEAMDAIFKHIGGVPTEIWFDNTSTIVTSILMNQERKLTDDFTRFMNHYGFMAKFMNPASGNEKGNVEAKVGYSRRNFLVPVPEFKNLSEYNKELLKKCNEDLERDHYSKQKKISEMFQEDRKHLRSLPSIQFDLTGFIRNVSTDAYGKFTLNKGKHEYSVSPRYARTHVNVRLTSATVTVLDDELKEIITHRRLYGDEKQTSMEWPLYLDYIARHPRSLKNTGIYSMLPETMQSYIGTCAQSNRKDILHILSELTKSTGFDSAVNTVNQAIAHQAKDPESLKSLYSSLYSDVPVLPPLESKASDFPKITSIATIDLNVYDAFLKGGLQK